MRRLPMRLLRWVLAAAVPLASTFPVFAATETAKESPARRPPSGQEGGVRMPTPAFQTEVPPEDWNAVLGRPTRDSITLSLLARRELEVCVDHGVRSDALTQSTPVRMLRAGEPLEFLLSGLPAGTNHYRVRTRSPGEADWTLGETRRFTTARALGEAFTFTVQADPHLDYGTDLAVYGKSLRNAVDSGTDFHVDLGDTFMTDKYAEFHEALPQYRAQRHWLGQVGRQAAVFLVLGNHDGEQPGRGGAGADSMPVWSNLQRKRHFPNPVPDGFYTGNEVPHPVAGLLQDYYAWHWGDALFVVLDPFWFSTRTRGGDNWSRTLGERQYRWLQQTLETSRARFRFVFLHHLAGGESREGRGGAEASRLFEWGGLEPDGKDGFATHRPGWNLPVHDLLVRNGVTAVFHGHDHFYARQQRDGMLYVLVPQPGHRRYDPPRSAAEYGYRQGEIQGPSGILRVRVSPEAARMEYVRAYPDAAESPSRRTGDVTDRMEIPARARPGR